MAKEIEIDKEDDGQDEGEPLFSEEDFDLILRKATRKLDEDEEEDREEE